MMRGQHQLFIAAAMAGTSMAAMTALTDSALPPEECDRPSRAIRFGNNRYQQPADKKHKLAKIAAKSRKRNRK